MPYKLSRSRSDFDNTTKELLRLSREASYKKNCISYSHQNMIYQSSIFLLSAAIEEYLKNFFDDLIFKYKSKNARIHEIPKNLLKITLFKENINLYKEYLYNSDEKRILKKINLESTIFNLLDSDEIVTDQIKSNNILATNKYPSEKNLRRVFNRIGIEDILHEVHKKGKKDYKSQLSSFLDVREAISHQSPPSVTYDDVKRHFINIKDLINKIDRILYSHITKNSNEEYWPAGG